MKKILLFLMLVLCSDAYAIKHYVTQADIPLIVPSTWSNDTIYFVGTKLTSARNTAITIQDGANNILVDGELDTLSFGEDGEHVDNLPGDRPRTNGFDIGDVDGLIIRDLFILHNPPDDSLISGIGLWAKCVWASKITNTYFYNCTFRAKGGNSQIFYSNGSSSTTYPYNVLLRNCKFYDLKNQFRSRTQWDEATMFQIGEISYGMDQADFQYHFKFVSCTTKIAYWNNIHAGGEATRSRHKIIIDSCYFKVDARNDTTESATEAFALAFRSGNDIYVGPSDYVKVTNTTIESGTDYAGGRGIFISSEDGAVAGDTNACIYIANNNINVHQGFDGQFDIGYGMKIRSNVNNLIIRNNNITVVADNDPTTSSYASSAVGIDCTSQNNASVDKTYLNSAMNWEIKHNTITVYNVNGGGTGTPDATCLMFQEYFENSTYNNVFDSNILVTNGTFATYTGGNGLSNYTTMRGNTYRYLSGNSPNDNSTYVGFMGPHGTNVVTDGSGHTVIDGVFENNVDPYHTFVIEHGHPHSIKIKFTLTVQVLGSNGAPVRECAVSAVDNYGHTILSGTTDVKGKVNFELPTYYDGNAAAGGIDSASYNPYTINVSKDGYSTSGTHTLSSTNRSMTINFSSVAGEDSLGTVKETPLDSLTGAAQWANPLGIPREQIVPLAAEGDLIVYVGEYAGGSIPLWLTYNLDSSVVWVDTDNSTGETYHAHLSVYNDTVFISYQETTTGGDQGKMTAYSVNRTTNTIQRLWSTLWEPYNPLTLYGVAAWRLPETDSALAITRGRDDAAAIRQWFSTDKGQNWTNSGYMVDRVGTGRVRLGMMYDWDKFQDKRTLGSVVDSGDHSIEWWTWDRYNRKWYQIGQAFNRPMFRGFDANIYQDSIRVMVGSKEASPRDSVLTAYQNINVTDTLVVTPFTEIPAMGTSVTAFGLNPYVSLTYVEAGNGGEGRLVLFYTQNDYSTADSVDIYARYWLNDTKRWSDPPVKVTRGLYAWKITSMSRVPASHGDVAYCFTTLDRIHGATRYQLGAVYRVIYGDSSVAADEPITPVDSSISVNDVIADESEDIKFIITLDPPPTENMTYSYITATGTATNPTDYAHISGTATIEVAYGSYQDTILVVVEDDPNDESNETFSLIISNPIPEGYGGPNSKLTGLGTILDNDNPPVIPTGAVKIKGLKKP